MVPKIVGYSDSPLGVTLNMIFFDTLKTNVG